ncbi:mucin-5AC [Drosophila sechellia]|uniref:mucin-5AC n=1 Tax=Drosophila sechellia TaxID=7238 RepID=UPI0013DD9FD7|nr:mucin-5AC [Drosophila sechellia]
MFMHQRDKLPFQHDEHDRQVFKDQHRNYLAPRNPPQLKILQEFPVSSSNGTLDDLKYSSQLEGSHDSSKYNKTFHTERYDYKQNGDSQELENIISEKNLQDSKAESQPKNMHSFRIPEATESHYNDEELQNMKDLHKELQRQYRSGFVQDKPGAEKVRETASQLILQWAENQRSLLDSFVKAITDVLKGHDPNTNRNMTPRDIILLKDMLNQLLELVMQLREDSSSIRTKSVLNKWIETQKSLIDSFSQAIENTNQNLDNIANVNEVMENLNKNLKELVILLSDKESFTATESSSSQQTTSSYSATNFYQTSSTFGSTHLIVGENINRINIMGNLIKGLRNIINQMNETNKTSSSTSYTKTESTFTHPSTSTYVNAEVTTSHPTTSTYEVTNLITEESKFKDMFNLIKGIEELISQYNGKHKFTTTTTHSSDGGITSQFFTTTTPKTVTTNSQSSTSSHSTTESSPSNPTTNNYEVTIVDQDNHKFKVMENLIKDLKGLINQFSDKKNITSATHLTGDSKSFQSTATTASTEGSSSHPVSSTKATTSTTTFQSTISNHLSTEGTSSQLNTSLSTTGTTHSFQTTNTHDFKDQINGDDSKSLKHLIKILSDLVYSLNDKNNIKSTSHLTTESTFNSSINTTNSTTYASTTFSTTESMAIHSTPYLSTTESSVSQFTNEKNINSSSQSTGENTNPIIFNNSTTMSSNIHSTTYNRSITENTASHLNLSTTEGSPTISHSITPSQTSSLSSYKDKIKNIVELLRKLRKIQKSLADKSKGQLSPTLISRVKAVLKQIVAGNIDSVNGDSAELEILLSTTVNPNEDTTDLTMEKLLKLLDDFEMMYNVLLDGSTTQSTTQNNTIFSTTYSTIFSTTQSISTTSPTQNALTSSTPNTSTTEYSSTNNLRSDVSNNLQPIVDAIQQLKMALYHDFYAFKKSQEERMEKILQLLSGKPIDRRTKPIAKPRTLPKEGSREIPKRNGYIKEEKIRHHNEDKFIKNRKNVNQYSHIPKSILNSSRSKIKKFPLKLSAIKVSGGLKQLPSKRKTNEEISAMHESFPEPLPILPHK